jgi:hypothetical protein
LSNLALELVYVCFVFLDRFIVLYTMKWCHVTLGIISENSWLVRCGLVNTATLVWAGCQSHKLVACRTYKCYICASLFLCHWGACQCLSPASRPFNGNVRTRPIHERNNDREIGRRPAFYVGRKWNHAWSVTNSVLSPIRRQSIAFIHNQRPPWPCVKSPSTMHGTKTHSA